MEAAARVQGTGRAFPLLPVSQLPPLLLQRAVQASSVSFTVADARAPGQPLLYVSEAFTATTGYTAAEAVGSNCRFLQGGGTDRSAVVELRRALDAGRSVSTTLLNYRKDGTAFWNELAIDPVRDEHGRVTHFVGVQTDVTSRKEADAARRTALEAERVARAEAHAALAEADRVRVELEATGRRLAGLYVREHRTALTLQRSMLPVLVDVPGLALAAEYLPSGQGAHVGGDWWDVFALPDGATGLAIGDVVGHDISAAAAMGQLRSVLRTCAWAGDDPATVLDRMDQLVQGFDMAQLATCVYARLEPPDGPAGRRRLPRLSWASAGHLPPLALAPTGQVHRLTGALSVPLGAPAAGPRAATALSFMPGTTLLLYTDGLVETRGGDIEADLDALVARVGQHPPGDGPAALVARLTRDLGPLDDDLAVLAVQVLAVAPTSPAPPA